MTQTMTPEDREARIQAGMEAGATREEAEEFVDAMDELLASGQIIIAPDGKIYAVDTDNEAN